MKSNLTRHVNCTPTLNTCTNHTYHIDSNITTTSPAELDALLERGKEKLAGLKEACKDIQPDDKAKINKEHDKLTREWRKRKRMCLDVVSNIFETYLSGVPRPVGLR
eukprot:sb/3477702/